MKVVIYVIAMYFLAHIFPLYAILIKQNILVNQQFLGPRYGLLVSYAIYLAYVRVYVLVLMISLYSAAIFVGLPYLILIHMTSVFGAYWVWTELLQTLLYIGMQVQVNYSKTLFTKEINKDAPDVEEVSGNHCICSFVMKLQPPDPIHSFVVYFCECQEDDAFYDLCSAFDVPESIRVKIATNNSSTIIRCLDALHRVYHRDKELTLTTIKTKLSEYSDELQQIISNYHPN